MKLVLALLLLGLRSLLELQDLLLGFDQGLLLRALGCALGILAMIFSAWVRSSSSCFDLPRPLHHRRCRRESCTFVLLCLVTAK
jgi:hypothetical protein